MTNLCGFLEDNSSKLWYSQLPVNEETLLGWIVFSLAIFWTKRAFRLTGNHQLIFYLKRTSFEMCLVKCLVEILQCLAALQQMTRWLWMVSIKITCLITHCLKNESWRPEFSESNVKSKIIYFVFGISDQRLLSEFSSLRVFIRFEKTVGTVTDETH